MSNLMKWVEAGLAVPLGDRSGPNWHSCCYLFADGSEGGEILHGVRQGRTLVEAGAADEAAPGSMARRMVVGESPPAMAPEEIRDAFRLLFERRGEERGRRLARREVLVAVAYAQETGRRLRDFRAEVPTRPWGWGPSLEEAMGTGWWSSHQLPERAAIEGYLIPLD